MTKPRDRNGRSRSIALPVAGAMFAALLGPAASLAQTASAPQAYRLAPGDRVSVLVFGQPDFSGDIVLDETGSISLPLLGRVGLGGLTPSEAEKGIAGQLSQGYLERPVVTLRLQEYRPIYVLGTVRSPGGYPYRHGLAVLGAVALAGGFGVADQPGTAARTEFLLADERLAILERNRRQLTIRLARLEAQRANLATIQFDNARPADADLHAQEIDLLTAQRQAQAERLELLRAQKPRLEAEIEGVRAQSVAERRQLELIQMHLKDYNELMASGLARRYTGIELQREEARNKGNIARIAAELARLDISIGEVALRINEAQESYLRRVMTELAETRQRLQELELTIPTARELREARLLQGGEIPLDDPGRRIVVTRDGPSGRIAVEAGPDYALHPGDVVEVIRKANPSARGALTSLERSPSASTVTTR